MAPILLIADRSTVTGSALFMPIRQCHNAGFTDGNHPPRVKLRIPNTVSSYSTPSRSGRFRSSADSGSADVKSTCERSADHQAEPKGLGCSKTGVGALPSSGTRQNAAFPGRASRAISELLFDAHSTGPIGASSDNFLASAPGDAIHKLRRVVLVAVEALLNRNATRVPSGEMRGWDGSFV